MNEAQVAAIVADETELTETKVREVCEEIKKTVINSIIEGDEEEVRFPRFGKFTKREVKAQKNRKIGPNLVDIPEQVVLDYQPFNAARKKFD